MTMASLRQEVAAEEAAELMEDATQLVRQREVGWTTEGDTMGHNISYDRRVRVPTRVYDTWQLHQDTGTAQSSSIAHMEDRDGESDGDRGDAEADMGVGIDAMVAHAGSMATVVTGGWRRW